MKLFRTKIHKNKSKKIAGVFDYKYIKCKGDEQVTIVEYREKIRPYLHDMINDLNKFSR